MAMTVNEEKKKRLNSSPTMDDAFTGEAFNVSVPIKKQAPMTPGNPDNESFYGGSNPQKNLEKLTGQTTLGEPKTLSLYEAPTNLNPPKINEIPNAQRDAELGKMNVSTAGDTTTYNIGESSLSYKLSDDDKKVKTNLEKINQMIESGVEVSPEQMVRINNLRQQAGYLRGGTDRGSVNPDGTSIKNNITSSRNDGMPQDLIDSYDRAHQEQYMQRITGGGFAPINVSPRGRFFGATPLPELAQNNGPKLFTKEEIPGWQEREEYNQQILNNYQSDKNTLATLGTQQNIENNKSIIDEETNRINKEKNRIDEISTISQNKLRDIQGQVAQQPPIKESPLKPIVIDEPDPNDPTGTSKRQKIMIPNPDGTGYIDGMNNQTNQTFATPKPATTKKLLKMRASKDPNFAAAEAEYKSRFGNLPY